MGQEWTSSSFAVSAAAYGDLLEAALALPQAAAKKETQVAPDPPFNQAARSSYLSDDGQC
jgi:hypothetical protein